MALPVARLTDRAFAMVRVGDKIIPEIGYISQAAQRVYAEDLPFARLTDSVVFPHTTGYITSSVAQRTIVENLNGALLFSRVHGGSIVGCGIIITSAQRTIAF